MCDSILEAFLLQNVQIVQNDEWIDEIVTELNNNLFNDDTNSTVFFCGTKTENQDLSVFIKQTLTELFSRIHKSSDSTVEIDLRQLNADNHLIEPVTIKNLEEILDQIEKFRDQKDSNLTIKLQQINSERKLDIIDLSLTSQLIFNNKLLTDSFFGQLGRLSHDNKILFLIPQKSRTHVCRFNEAVEQTRAKTNEKDKVVEAVRVTKTRVLKTRFQYEEMVSFRFAWLESIIKEAYELKPQRIEDLDMIEFLLNESFE